MDCTCQELERQQGEGKCKCVHYRKKFPDCACEDESVSKHSPGKVGSDEILLRAVFNDVQVDRKTGRLTTLYFRKEPSTRGFSVNRRCHVGDSDLERQMQSHQSYDEKSGLRFAAADCESIRELKEDGNRLFCVYDSALKDDLSHADICQNKHLSKGEDDRKQRMLGIARNLARAFGRVAPLDQVQP